MSSRNEKKHDENIKKAKLGIQLEMEKSKKHLDDKITKSHPLWKPGQLVKILNHKK